MTREETAAAATELLRKLAVLTDEAAEEVLGRRKGFIIFLFDFGDGSDGLNEMHYVSNSDREDACTSLAEYLMTQSPEILRAVVDRVTAQQVNGPERMN